MPRRVRVCCQESSSSKLNVYIAQAVSVLRSPPSTAATTSAFRRATQRRVPGRGRSAKVIGFPSGPITTCCMEKSLRMKGDTAPGTWLIEEHFATAKAVMARPLLRSSSASFTPHGFAARFLKYGPTLQVPHPALLRRGRDLGRLVECRCANPPRPLRGCSEPSKGTRAFARAFD
jgi:hypothetical protein